MSVTPLTPLTTFTPETPRRRWLRAVLTLVMAAGPAATWAQSAAPAPAAGAVPATIRIGSPELGSGPNGFPGGNPLAVLRARQWLEQEFSKDGIKVEWTFFRAAGPAVNEAVAAGQLDVVFLGDLASVIGKARGLPTRLIALSGRSSNSYLAVAPGSDIQKVADLKGRKVAVLKGTAYQRPFDALLAEVGLSEKEVKVINMDWPTAKAAVVNRDVDATFGGADLHLLQDKGVRLPVSTKGRGPGFTINGAVLATEEFIGRYPQVTTRLVKQLVRASQWASEESNRAPLLALWGEQSGQGAALFQAEFEGETLKHRHSPLIDEASVAAYKGVVADALKLGLIRQNIDVDAWVVPQFVQTAVKELKLDGYWPRFDAKGKVLP